MKLALASDHAGFPLKETIKKHLLAEGIDLIDLGTDSTAAVDYPDFARAIGEAIKNGKADRGILLCGSGVGASVAANKIPGVRAGLCHDNYSAHQGVEHDDMNVLVLGSRIIGEMVAFELVDTFLKAAFTHEARHERRLAKVNQIEKDYTAGK